MMRKIKTAKRTSKMTLKQAQKYLSKIDNINEGGCGISALAMYQFIKNNGRIGNTKFVFLYNRKKRYLNNRKSVDGGKVYASSHCCLFNDGKFIDCDGIVKDVKDYRWIHMADEEEFIVRAINNVGDWNSNFDRKHVREIEMKLNVELGVEVSR